MSKETLDWLAQNTLIGLTDIRGKAWHALNADADNHYAQGVPVEDVRSRLFHWTPQVSPVQATIVTDDGVTTVESADQVAIVRPDTQTILGIHGSGYQVHGYDEWLTGNVSKMLDEDGLVIGSAGLLVGGAVAFVQVQTPETITGPGGQEFNPFILAVTSLNGKFKTTYKGCVQRVVCHKEGTMIQDRNFRGKVEDHPSANGSKNESGFQVRVAGLPHTETVTVDHRYWTQDGWIEARDLQVGRHVIGMPINMDEVPAPEIDIATRVASGRYDSNYSWSTGHDPRLDSEDWMWLIGYWWGNGHTGKVRGQVAQITLSIPDDHPEYLNKIVGLARSLGSKAKPVQKVGCSQVTFNDRTLANLLSSWSFGRGQKRPAAWVETLPFNLQRALVKGYFDADGDKKTTEGAIIPSVSFEGLLTLRTILARLGVPSSIRNNKSGGPSVVLGRNVNTQRSWTIRFWRNTDWLGISHRFTGKLHQAKPYVSEGYLWSEVSELVGIADAAFVPITTDDHTYLTAFGRSHNCDNTLAVGVAEKTGAYSIKHTKNSAMRVQDARDALGIIQTTTDAFSAEVDALLNMTVTDGQWEAFLDEYSPLPTESGRGQTVAEKRRNDLSDLYYSDERVGFTGTAWGVQQAVDTYTQWGTRVNKGTQRFERTILGAAAGTLWDEDKTAMTALASVGVGA